jgi:hypothetical protein
MDREPVYWKTYDHDRTSVILAGNLGDPPLPEESASAFDAQHMPSINPSSAQLLNPTFTFQNDEHALIPNPMFHPQLQ